MPRPSRLCALLISVAMGSSALGDGQVVAWGRDSGGQAAPASVSLVPFVDAAAGLAHTLMLRADGTVFAIGLNDGRQCSVPMGLGSVTAIAGGGQHSLALLGSGRIVGWGGNASGECLGTDASDGPILGVANGVAVRVAGVEVMDAVRISAGGHYDPVADVVIGHSVALRRDGTPIAWGSTTHGQGRVPEQAAACLRVAAGGQHSLAVRASDGGVFAWGLNDQAQCGGTAADGTPRTGSAPGPVQVLGAPLTGVLEIAAGDAHSVALLGDGTVACWGSNLDLAGGFAGQCTPPATLSGVVGISAGGWHTIARRADGTVTCWGSDLDWDGMPSGQSTVPPGTTGVRRIAAGGVHSIAITQDGKAIGWGYRGDGCVSFPRRVQGVKAIDSGSEHTVGLLGDGTVIAWGLSDQQQCSVPTGLNQVTQLAAGGWHTLALRLNGSVVAWGSTLDFNGNPVGQSTVPSNLPTAKWVGAGLAHSLAVLGSGQVRAWGMNSSGQCLGTSANGLPITTTATGTQSVRILGSTLSGVSQASGGGTYSLALRSAGTLVAWGSAPDGAATVPPGLSGVTRIAVGYCHNLALRSNGTVAAWGSNDYPTGDVRQTRFAGQSQVPSGLAGVVDIAAGQAHSAALRSDGTMVCWGSNESFNGTEWIATGQSQVVPNLSGVSAMACGDNTTLAILDGSLVSCAGATAPGGATLKISGGAWQDVNIWQWSDTGPRVPGALSDVDLGTYGSVGLDCDAHAGTLTMHPGSSLVVPFDLDARVPAAAALQVSGTASLAGRVWLLASGDADRLPADLHVPVLECSSPSGTNFGFIQSSVPAPDGMFLTLSTEVVAGRTGFALTLAPLTVTGSLSSTSARPFSGKAVAAATIDVNHDGLDDLALAVDNGVSSPGALQVLLNDPSNPGTLGTGSLYLALPPRPSCLGVGDLDGDGFKDVVVGLSSDATVRVFTGNAGGTLAPGLVIGSVTGSPLSVAVIEPGSPLLPSSGTVSVGTSSSKVQTFSSAGTTLSTVTISGPATVMAVGSADGTRGRDIATGGTRSSSVNGFASGAETGFVEVLVDSGSGYVVSSSVSLTGEPVGIDMADLDGDGLDDIVTANANPQLPASGSVLPVLSILRNASGSFDGAIAYQPSGSSAGLSVTMLDVDGDGDRDIVSVFTVVGTDSAASLLRVDSSGAGGPISVGSETPLPSEDPVLAARGELDGTGEEDAYLVDENAAPPSLVGVRAARPFLSSATPVGVPGDLDGDGHVNTADLALLLLDFGPCPGCLTDLDGTGEVDTSDLALLLLLFD